MLKIVRCSGYGRLTLIVHCTHTPIAAMIVAGHVPSSSSDIRLAAYDTDSVEPLTSAIGRLIFQSDVMQQSSSSVRNSSGCAMLRPRPDHVAARIRTARAPYDGVAAVVRAPHHGVAIVGSPDDGISVVVARDDRCRPQKAETVGAAAVSAPHDVLGRRVDVPRRAPGDAIEQQRVRRAPGEAGGPRVRGRGEIAALVQTIAPDQAAAPRL